jgi:hypothetical protein
MSAFRFHKTAKAILVAVWFLGAACVVSLLVLSTDWVQSRPANPEAAPERVCTWNVHGHIIYLTRSEKLLVTSLVVVFFGAVIAAVPLGFVVLCSSPWFLRENEDRNNRNRGGAINTDGNSAEDGNAGEGAKGGHASSEGHG